LLTTGALVVVGCSAGVDTEPVGTTGRIVGMTEDNAAEGSPAASVGEPLLLTDDPLAAGLPEAASEHAEVEEAIEQPAKVMRIGSMVKQLLDEVRAAPLDERSRIRLKEIYEQSVRELADSLSPDLAKELDRMALPFDDRVPSESELRVAQAQLVGWLEGLFHGIQAALVAQQMAARAQLEEMRRRGLPAGDSSTPARGGAYL
jgi:hypothetical protein